MVPAEGPPVALDALWGRWAGEIVGEMGRWLAFVEDRSRLGRDGDAPAAFLSTRWFAAPVIDEAVPDFRSGGWLVSLLDEMETVRLDAIANRTLPTTTRGRGKSMTGSQASMSVCMGD